jgi:uncharacterized protein YjiS (DUF1127 family)
MPTPRGYFENLIGSVGLLIAALVLLGLWMFQCAARAGQRRALRQLDGRLLRDVGLTPAQVAIEARKSAWRH